MTQFKIVPQICTIDSVKKFCSGFGIGKGDLVFLSKSTESYFSGLLNGVHVIYRGDYGKGEPTDAMVEKIFSDIKSVPYSRVIAVGGGTIIDVAKLLALKQFSPVTDLFDKKIYAERTKKLVIVPTTCGTGSEVTNISILELTLRHTKLGLADDALFADSAVLIPELLEKLPFRFFATSSIDALVHATESYLSPKATPFSQLYSIEAVKKILNGYMTIKHSGPDARIPLLSDFLLAGTYAGIAFGNAGTGAVHAMSYSFGASYHVPHGEANYTLYTAVFKKYQKLAPEGAIKKLNELISSIIYCDTATVYESLEELLDVILQKKSLHEYGVTESDLVNFTENTITKQGRLTANEYVPLDETAVMEIYRSVF
jgi:4-hydroxybutyrate dehydrogenase